MALDQEKRDDMLIEVHGKVMVIDERTEGLKDLTERVAKVENDVKWIRRLGVAIVPTTGFLGALVGTITRTFS